MTKYWFFDLDGTLADTDPDIRAAWKAALRDLAVECPNFDRDFVAGPTIEEMARRLLPDVGDRKIETYVTFVCGGCLALMERWLSEGMVESSALLASAAEQIMERGVAFLR